MIKQARYFRWGILFVTIIVEVMAFWFGGPRSDPQSSLSSAILFKLGHPMSWAWVGWASLSMAWLWGELAFIFYSNGRRARALLKRSNHEKLVFDTGVHWLVLLRDIHLNFLNDGNEAKLEENLFVSGAKRSFAWHAIWWPLMLATLTMLYYVGWLAWSLNNMPQNFQSWSASVQETLQDVLPSGLSVVGVLLSDFLRITLQWTEELHALARGQTVLMLAMVAGGFIALFMLARVSKSVMLLSWLSTAAGRLLILIGVFGVLSSAWFDWLSPLYRFVPHHGIIAMGFFPLTLASAFYFPHILFWSSWRYAVIRDVETHDATLMIVGGVLNSLQRRINLQRIVDTDIFQHWWQRLLDVGDIELKEMGGGESQKVRHIYGPYRLLDEIRDAIRESKKRSASQSEFGEDGEFPG